MSSDTSPGRSKDPLPLAALLPPDLNSAIDEVALLQLHSPIESGDSTVIQVIIGDTGVDKEPATAAGRAKLYYTSYGFLIGILAGLYIATWQPGLMEPLKHLISFILGSP